MPFIHPYFRKRGAGCIQQAQLIHLSLSKVCSTTFSSKALNPSSTSICESPARHTIFASHAEKMVPLCQIFHLRASFRPDLSLDYHVCNHGWTHCGLPSGQNCVAIHNTRTNSSSLTMPRSCISLYSGNLPSGPAEEKEETPRRHQLLPRRRRRTNFSCHSWLLITEFASSLPPTPFSFSLQFSFPRPFPMQSALNRIWTSRGKPAHAWNGSSFPAEFHTQRCPRRLGDGSTDSWVSARTRLSTGAHWIGLCR